MSRFAVIGQPAQAIGGREVVTGQAKYVADLHLPGMLEGKLLYTRYPNARILSMDTLAARQLPGVQCVLTAADIPGENSYLYAFPPDQPLLVIDAARYQGDALAAVAAEDEASAQAALEAIQVEYEPLPGVFDPVEALRPGAPQVWPGKSNLCDHLVIHYGDIEAGFAKADLVIERTYRTPLVEHAFLEPEGAVAYLDEDGIMVIYASCQAPHRDRMQIARALGVAQNRVRVITPYVGGAFGGKDEATVQIHAALLAQATRRPVRIIRTREESILTHVKRHPVTIYYRSGVKRDGKLVAVQVEATGDAGPYTNASREVMGLLAVTSAGPYYTPNAHLEARTVYTNNPISGAMRGFGIPQSTFACEAQMDELARALHMDPLQIRLINGLETGMQVPTGVTIREGRGMKASLLEAADLANWRARRQIDPPPASHLRRGWGLAAVGFSIGMGRNIPDHSGASLQMATDGTVILSTGAADMGQGAHTALAQLAAEALGVELDAVRVVRPDTEKTFDAGASVASRQTFVSGNAVLRAAQPIHEALLETAAEETGLPKEVLSLQAGRVFADGEQLPLTVASLAAKAGERDRRLHADGFYAMEYPEELPPGAYPYAPAVYTFGAQVARVLVDLDTGQVTVEALYAAHDPGKVINPDGAQGQVEGGCAMALGYALMEELQVKDGHTLNPSFDSYLIPTARDVPEIRVALLEYPEPYAPYGAKGLGEPPVAVTAPAIRNAVADALIGGLDASLRTSIHLGADINLEALNQIPLTPERVLAAIEALRTQSGPQATKSTHPQSQATSHGPTG